MALKLIQRISHCLNFEKKVHTEGDISSMTDYACERVRYATGD